MPTYEYRCHTCGIHFEYIQTMREPALVTCPVDVCPLEVENKGSGIVERRISAGTGLVFKGSGFYITDYKGATTSPKSEGGSVKKEEGTSSPASVAPTPAPKPAKPSSE